MGNDFVTTLAAHSGQLQLNAYEPVEGLASIESQDLLYNVSKLFRTKCIDGIKVNEEVLAHYMETTVGIVTALNPIVGYEKATELANEAYKSNGRELDSGAAFPAHLVRGESYNADGYRLSTPCQNCWSPAERWVGYVASVPMKCAAVLRAVARDRDSSFQQFASPSTAVMPSLWRTS